MRHQRNVHGKVGEINTTGVPAAAARVPAATAARGYTDAPDSAISDCPFPATARGFCLQTSLYYEYFGAHVSEDDMASSR